MLRVIERATRQAIEPMQLPSVEDVNERRVARFNEKLSAAIASGAGQVFLPLILNYERDHKVPAAEIAAALASIAQGTSPLLLDAGRESGSAEAAPRFERPAKLGPSTKPHHKPAREDRRDEPRRDAPKFDTAKFDTPRRAEPMREEFIGERVSDEAAPREETRREQPAHADRKIRERSGEREARKPFPPREFKSEGKSGDKRVDDDVETYRIEVGLDHGVKANNIVGAIANEVGLEGKRIGRVVIRDDHSFVDLPAGMPKEVFLQLQKVRVGGQKLQISRALKTHVEKLRRERPAAPKFKGKNKTESKRRG
jgi:ATP-dependent RNA helicase DeaD